jgi:hypothetical protein
MTVRELARVLALIPKEYQDLKIIDCSYEIIKGYWRFCPDHPMGDPANPNCKYEDVIYIE